MTFDNIVNANAAYLGRFHAKRGRKTAAIRLMEASLVEAHMDDLARVGLIKDPVLRAVVKVEERVA
jgi:hypothetical protein